MSKFDQNRIKDGWEKTLHKQTNKPTDTTKIMVTWPWTKNVDAQKKRSGREVRVVSPEAGRESMVGEINVKEVAQRLDECVAGWSWSARYRGLTWEMRSTCERCERRVSRLNKRSHNKWTQHGVSLRSRHRRQSLAAVVWNRNAAPRRTAASNENCQVVCISHGADEIRKYCLNPQILDWQINKCRQFCPSVKAKFHYAILIADRSEAGRRPASSC